MHVPHDWLPLRISFGQSHSTVFIYISYDIGNRTTAATPNRAAPRATPTYAALAIVPAAVAPPPSSPASTTASPTLKSMLPLPELAVAFVLSMPVCALLKVSHLTAGLVVAEITQCQSAGSGYLFQNSTKYTTARTKIGGNNHRNPSIASRLAGTASTRSTYSTTDRTSASSKTYG